MWGKGAYSQNLQGFNYRVKNTEESSDSQEKSNCISDILCNVHSISNSKIIQLTVEVEGYSVLMDVDTGSGVTIINKNNWERIGKPLLEPCKCQFKSYSGHGIKLRGQSIVNVRCAGNEAIF